MEKDRPLPLLKEKTNVFPFEIVGKLWKEEDSLTYTGTRVCCDKCKEYSCRQCCASKDQDDDAEYSLTTLAPTLQQAIHFRWLLTPGTLLNPCTSNVSTDTISEMQILNQYEFTI